MVDLESQNILEFYYSQQWWLLVAAGGGMDGLGGVRDLTGWLGVLTVALLSSPLLSSLL